MFENLSHLALQQYWWIIIALLGSILVFMMFVQGGQTLFGQIAKNDSERSMLVNSIGRKWDITFTTLVTFGGAFFASFPLFYSTSFGGAYWVWMIILFSFVIQAVSYEFRTKPENFLGTKTFDTFLFINGILGTVLIGAAVGTFFTGSEFSIDKMRITDVDNPVISQWKTATHGLEAALNITNLSLGLAVLFLARIMGAMYFIISINNNNIWENAKKQVKINTLIFLPFFLTFVVLLLLKDGFAVDASTQEVKMESYKYLSNLIEMPIVLIILLLGVVAVLLGIFLTVFKDCKKGIWYTGPGAIAVAFALFLIAGFNDTAYYPSTFDLQSSLTIQNSSSSKYTLTAMSYVSLFVPVVVAYIWYAWRALSKRKIDEEDLSQDTMKY